MDIMKAKEIIAILADGIDPTTGELLPEDNVCNKPEIVRAFYTILNNNANKNNNSNTNKSAYENAGMPWTDEDDAKLIEMYNTGIKRSEIQSFFKRSPGSIKARLIKLGLIDN